MTRTLRPFALGATATGITASAVLVLGAPAHANPNVVAPPGPRTTVTTIFRQPSAPASAVAASPVEPLAAPSLPDPSLSPSLPEVAPLASQAADVQVANATAPDAPRGLSAVGGAERATVTWAAPADDHGSLVTAYVLTWQRQGDDHVEERTVDASRSTATITGLAGQGTYVVQVVAVSGAGRSAPAGPITVTAFDQPLVLLGSSEAEAGGSLLVTGRGFAPGSDVAVALHSNPVPLGTARVDGDGRFSLSVRMPASVPAGAHTVVATGTGADGKRLEVDQPVVVGGDLAATGMDACSWLALASALVCMGIGALASRRVLRSRSAA